MTETSVVGHWDLQTSVYLWQVVIRKQVGVRLRIMAATMAAQFEYSDFNSLNGSFKAVELVLEVSLPLNNNDTNILHLCPTVMSVSV